MKKVLLAVVFTFSIEIFSSLDRPDRAVAAQKVSDHLTEMYLRHKYFDYDKILEEEFKRYSGLKIILIQYSLKKDPNFIIELRGLLIFFRKLHESAPHESFPIIYQRLIASENYKKFEKRYPIINSPFIKENEKDYFKAIFDNRYKKL